MTTEDKINSVVTSLADTHPTLSTYGWGNSLECYQRFVGTLLVDAKVNGDKCVIHAVPGQEGLVVDLRALLEKQGFTCYLVEARRFRMTRPSRRKIMDRQSHVVLAKTALEAVKKGSFFDALTNWFDVQDEGDAPFTKSWKIYHFRKTTKGWKADGLTFHMPLDQREGLRWFSHDIPGVFRPTEDVLKVLMDRGLVEDERLTEAGKEALKKIGRRG